MVQLRTAGGKQCHINNRREAVHGYDQRIEVFGSAGMLLRDSLCPTTIRRWSRTVTDALVDSKELPTGVHDGLKALRLAECALEAANTGRTVTV